MARTANTAGRMRGERVVLDRSGARPPKSQASTLGKTSFGSAAPMAIAAVARAREVAREDFDPADLYGDFA